MSFSLLAFIFLPQGRVAPRQSLWHCFFKLLPGQLALLIFTLAGFVAFSSQGPIYVDPPPNLSEIAEMIKDMSLIKWGIYPWGIYGLWAIIIAYCVGVKKGAPFFYQIAENACPKKLRATTKMAVESANTGATISVLSLTAASIVLLFTYTFQSIFNVQHLLVPVITIMALFLISPFYLFKKGRKRIAKLAKKGLDKLYLVMIVVFVILLGVASYGNLLFAKAYPELVKASACPECRAFFTEIATKTRFTVLYWGWFFIWMPLAGSYCAKVAMGYSLRQFIIALYAVPALILVVYLIWGLAPFAALVNSLNLIPKSLLFAGLGLLASICFYRLIKGVKTSDFLVSGVIPAGSIKPDRVHLNTPPKITGLSKHTMAFVMNLLGAIFLHTMMGWYGMQFQVAAMAFPLIGVIYLGFLLLIPQLLSRSRRADEGE